LLASGLWVSVFGLPVVGSVGCVSEVIEPHRAPPAPQGLTLMAPSSESQVPIGSTGKAASVDAARIGIANAVARAGCIMMGKPSGDSNQTC